MKKEAKDKGYQLFMIGMDQNDIAEILEVQPKTVTTWVQEGKWKEKRQEQLLRKETNEESVQKLIAFQLRVLDIVRTEAEKALEALTNNKAKTGSKKLIELQTLLIARGDIDALQKLHTIVKGKDVEWTTYIKIIREFIAELSEANNTLAKDLTPYVNEFLNNKRKEL